MNAHLSFASHRQLAIFLITLLLAACSSSPKEVAEANKAASASTPSTLAAATPSGSTIASAHGSGQLPTSGVSQAASSQGNSAGGVKWTAPTRWKLGPEKQMRAATYLISAASGDSEDAECAVFFGIGGGVEANLQRWVSQFEQPDGKPSEPLAKQKKETINGLAVTTIDLTGTFGGGGQMMGQGGKKTGYRLLGAIVEAPQGEIFFKLTGPAKTVAAAQAEFQSMLKSLSKP